jgi:uncharacterized cupin superfamily protein
MTNDNTVLCCPAAPDCWTDVGYAVPGWVAEGDPFEQASVFLQRPGAVVGVWRARAGTLRIDAYPFDEFCVVLEGRCTLTPEGGTARHFGPGEAFVVRQGFRGTWAMPEGLRKFYVELPAGDGAAP